eukprot:CAMPEP_0182873620 /NCGR_PEP_ID=MMETSP0034_2-20130328/12441_1 /TAXON_ID=156128 /ORGANISM="Nephroselmis pyriformis, Strain CCMP717" /LENGTH=204 /DNA_ID=CAMNT_0025006279 /DNA_START=53 /DNA_END=667 /DNA_ORIENTATION=-
MATTSFSMCIPAASLRGPVRRRSAPPARPIVGPLPFRLVAGKGSGRGLVVRATAASEDDKPGLSAEVEEATKKYGLEAGLWKAFKSGGSGEDGKPSAGSQAKQLLKVYGSAYLITSISLSLVSISICYALVSSGVDIGSLLGKVGLEVTSTSTNVGTFALAYAAHKALSPVRFPPTVALTPMVAKAMGKEVSAEAEGSKEPGPE